MKQQLLSFFAGFFLVLAIAGVKQYGFSGTSHSRAIAASGNYVSIIDEGQSQRTFLAKKLSVEADYILSVMGKDIQAVLREPELIRQDRPTIIWQYRSASCVLDVYFATENEDPLFAPVVHYEIRGRQAEEIKPQVQKDCLRSLMAERAQESSS